VPVGKIRLRNYRFEQIAEIIALVGHVRFGVIVSRGSWWFGFFSGLRIFFLLLG
jgi:hypothetical protein